MIPMNFNPVAAAGTFDTTTTGKATGKTNPTDSAEDAKLKKAAGDFESILLASMWKGMKDSFGTTDAEDSDPASGTLNDWGIEIMSGAVGKARGLGIGNLILKHLEPTLDGKTGQSSEPATGALGAISQNGRRGNNI